MPDGLALVRTCSDDPRLGPLLAELDDFLHSTDGDELHEKVAPFNRLDIAACVVIAEWNGEPAGCGALRRRDGAEGEIKRMFVRPAFRGRRIGRAILSELEAWAAELGMKRLVLETTLELEAAVALYLSAGFEPIPSYPPYDRILESSCFAKPIAAPPPSVPVR
jgi:putative acetyltransferase